MKKAKNSFLKFPQIFIKSIYDLDYYRILDKLSLGKGILYLVVLSLILGLMAMMPIIIQTHRDYQQVHQAFLDNSPDFSIENNRLVTDVETPFVIYEQEGKKFYIALDKEDEIPLNQLYEYETAVVFYSDTIYLRHQTLTQQMDYSSIFIEDVTKEQILSMFNIFQLSYLMFGFFFLLYFLFTRFLMAVLLALVVRLIAFFTRRKVPFVRSFNFACYGSTLPTIITTMVYVFSFQILYFDLIYLLILFLYVWTAIKRVVPKETPTL